MFVLPKIGDDIEFLVGHHNNNIRSNDVDNISGIFNLPKEHITIISCATVPLLSTAERLSKKVGKISTSLHTVGVTKASSSEIFFALGHNISSQMFDYKGHKFLRYVKSDGSYGDAIYYAAPRGVLSKIITSTRKQIKKKMILENNIKDIIKNRIVRYHRLIRDNHNLPNSGIIFYGPPGNGKSLIVQHLMSINRINPHLVTSREVMDNDIPIFNSSATYIFDDTDINYFSRENSSAAASYLLSFMDGKTKNPNVFILTTNEDVGTIDAAFLRPGRFNIVVKIGTPSKELRKEFVESWNIKIDIDKLTTVSDGWSFAELEFIKTCLIMQEFNEEELSLDKAIADFHKRQEEERKYMGFRP